MCGRVALLSKRALLIGDSTHDWCIDALVAALHLVSHICHKSFDISVEISIDGCCCSTMGPNINEVAMEFWLYDTMLYITIRCDTMLCNSMQCDVIRYDMIRYDMLCDDTMQG
jgi:hypothetical protein